MYDKEYRERARQRQKRRKGERERESAQQMKRENIGEKDLEWVLHRKGKY